MAKHTSKASYRVECMDANGRWYPAHNGKFKRYSQAVAVLITTAYARIVADYFGNGDWVDVASERDDAAARLSIKFDAEKRADRATAA